MTPECPSVVAEFAAQAAEYVRRAVGVDVSYDSETLPLLDHYLSTVPSAQTEATTLVIATAGAYFGEVVRRAMGGRWEAGPDLEPVEWRLVLPIGLSFRPADMVLAAMVREEESDAELHVPAVLQSYAADALERMGEVSEDDYYSLCGRFDTLEHLHSVLVGVAADHKKRSELN